MHDVSGELQAGERLLWSGRAQQGIRFVGRDVLLVPLTVIWATGAIGVAGRLPSTEGAPAGIGVAVWAITGLFIAAGLYLSVGRLLHDAWIRSRLHYTLTDRRALIRDGRRMTEVALATAPEITLDGGADGGRGTVRFGPKASLFWFWPRMGWYVWLPSLEPTPQFIGIDDARTVFDQARAAAQAGA